MQRVINVTNLNGVHSTTPLRGRLALREMYLWPAWYNPKSNVLFTYENKNQPKKLYRVFFKNKTYTFKDIQSLVIEHLDHNKNKQVNISHSSGKVTLMLNVKNDPSFLLHKIQFSEEMLNVLKLPKKDDYTGVTSGSDVALDNIKLTLNDTDILYLRCSEIDKTKVLENSINSDLMAVIPLHYSTHNNKLISYRDLKPLFHPMTKQKIIYNLHFSIQDSQGNNLPFHKCIFTVLNKDELL